MKKCHQADVNQNLSNRSPITINCHHNPSTSLSQHLLSETNNHDGCFKVCLYVIGSHTHTHSLDATMTCGTRIQDCFSSVCIVMARMPNLDKTLSHFLGLKVMEWAVDHISKSFGPLSFVILEFLVLYFMYQCTFHLISCHDNNQTYILNPPSSSLYQNYKYCWTHQQQYGEALPSS